MEIEIEIFYFRRQYKLFFRCLKKLGDCEIRNIKNIQKIEKKFKFYKNINSGSSVFNNLFFIISKADWILATIFKK